MVKAVINKRDMGVVKTHANAKCRFSSSDGVVVITDAVLVHGPMEEAADPEKDGDPNYIKCRTPIWNLHGQKSETVKLDLSLNGQQFAGNPEPFDFTFTEDLLLHRNSPMSGPLGGNTHTRLVGQGFKPIDKKLKINSKWGPIMTEKIARADVSDYVYSHKGWSSQFSGVPDFEDFWFGKIMAER